MSETAIIANTGVIAENKQEAADGLSVMDRRADRVIAGWTFGGLGANLLPPPFDVVAVSAVFVKMGQQLAQLYEVEITSKELKPPPIVAAIAYSVGSSFKAYYRILKTEGRALSPEELRELTTQALRRRIG